MEEVYSHERPSLFLPNVGAPSLVCRVHSYSPCDKRNAIVKVELYIDLNVGTRVNSRALATNGRAKTSVDHSARRGDGKVSYQGEHLVSLTHCVSIVTWLILPVVICLSQRLSHACLSTDR